MYILFSCLLEPWLPLLNFETIRVSLMWPKCLRLVSLAQIICTLHTFSSLWCSLCFQRITASRIYLATLASDRVCVVSIERLSALHFVVYFLFFGIVDPLWYFENIRVSLMRPKWLMLVSLAHLISTLHTFNSFVCSLLPNDNIFK